MERLHIHIENFGPITEGTINLRPLTLFIGPNNSGKSYAATLIHSILESYPAFQTFRHALHEFWRRPPFAEYPVTKLRKQFEDLIALLQNAPEGQEVQVPKSIATRITRQILEEIYEKHLSEEIVRAYSCALHELVREGNSAFELALNLNSHQIALVSGKKKLKIRHYPDIDLDVVIRVPADVDQRLHWFRKDNKITLELPKSLWAMPGQKRLRFDRALPLLLTEWASLLFKNLSMPSAYLPAARSGLLQGHKALAASIVKRAPYVGIERLEIPRFSGVVSDFMSSLIALPAEKGPLYQLARSLEKDLLRGEIVLRTPDEYRYSEINYTFGRTEIPLHRASSTVSEVAPLVLYLKYQIEPNDLLIIEEPEAHLHPQNQRILAKYLVRLIRKNVNVMVTTHSDYLLQQLNSFLLLSRIPPQRRVEKYKYGQEDYLHSHEVAVYLFAHETKPASYKISPVEITEEDGISEDEFVKIHEALYEETVELRKDLGQ